MLRFIITVAVGTILHAVACIIKPPFEFGHNRLECFFFAFISGLVAFPFMVAVLLPLREILRRSMPQRTQRTHAIVAAGVLPGLVAALNLVLLLLNWKPSPSSHGHLNLWASWSLFVVALVISFFWPLAAQSTVRLNTARKFRYVFLLALAVIVTSSGCAGQRFAEPVGFSNLKITGWPYQTKPRWLADTEGMFYWFVTEDRKTIGYEPCCGMYAIDLLKESGSELIFTVAESRGKPLDLRDGHPVAKSDVVGKKYEAQLQGDQIVAISEVK